MTDLTDILLMDRSQLWPWFYKVILSCFLAWILIKLIEYPFSYIWSRGYDSSKQLAPFKRFCKVFMISIASMYVIKSFFMLSNTLTFIVFLATILVSIISQLPTLANFISGLLIQLQGHINVGVDISINNISGTVSSIDLLHIWLESDSGEQIAIPNSLVFGEPFKINKRSHRFEVKLEVTLKSGTIQELTELRTIILSSPYRKSGSPISIDRKISNTGIFSVNFCVWNEQMIPLAKEQFQRQFQDLLLTVQQ